MNTQREAQERRYTRVQLPIKAEVSGVSSTVLSEAAHLRDICAGGAFFYARLQPISGTVVRIEFTVPGIASDLQVSAEGRVLRVETGKLGELNGIAVAFEWLNLGSW